MCVSLFQYQVSWYGTFIAGYSPWQHGQHPLSCLPPYLAIWLVHANFLDDISQTLTGQAEKKFKLKIVLKGGKKEKKNEVPVLRRMAVVLYALVSPLAPTHSAQTDDWEPTFLFVVTVP